MQTLYLNKDAKLEREDSTLIVRTPSTPKRRVPIHGLRHVVIAGEAGMTTALMALFGQNGVRVTVLDWHGNVAGSFEPRGAPSSGKVRLAQARHALDPILSIELARTFVIGAITNLSANLRYRAYRGLQSVQPNIDALQEIKTRLNDATNCAALMGYEGSARAWYYQAWPLIDSRLAFGARKRRPPNNRINCLISWFNGLAYSMTRNEIAKTHLDDCISFLHSSTEARHSLALDISEIFKPAICDPIIFELVLRNRLEDNWFHEEAGVCRLSEQGRKETLLAWVAKTDTAEKGGISMRDQIRADALALERHVLGIAPYKPWRRKV